MLLALLGGVPALAAQPAQTGASARYVCSDGRAIEVIYGGGVAVITVDGATSQLARAPSADGERYIGNGWQWWSKATRSGTLARLAEGKDVASGGTTCRAP